MTASPGGALQVSRAMCLEQVLRVTSTPSQPPVRVVGESRRRVEHRAQVRAVVVLLAPAQLLIALALRSQRPYGGSSSTSTRHGSSIFFKSTHSLQQVKAERDLFCAEEVLKLRAKREQGGHWAPDLAHLSNTSVFRKKRAGMPKKVGSERQSAKEWRTLGVSKHRQMESTRKPAATSRKGSGDRVGVGGSARKAKPKAKAKTQADPPSSEQVRPSRGAAPHRLAPGGSSRTPGLATAGRGTTV